MFFPKLNLYFYLNHLVSKWKINKFPWLCYTSLFHSQTSFFVTRNPISVHPFSPSGNYRFPNLFSVVPNHEAMEIRHGPTRMDGSLDRSALRGDLFRMDGSLGAENGVVFFDEGDVWGGGYGAFTGKDTSMLFLEVWISSKSSITIS